MDYDTRDPKAVADLLNAQEKGHVIGLAAVTGQVLPRRDIDDLLLHDAPCFNLFLLALRALQAPEQQQNPMGYYQIAGIHGLPRIPWNDVKVPQKEAGAMQYAGYCAHSVITFATWHRPYIALLEQTIYSKIIDLVRDWLPKEERADQIKAAGRFRMPYWDYWKARGGELKFPGVRFGRDTIFDYDFRMPDIFVATKVMVRAPEAPKLVPIDNPLASFKFPGKESDEAWGDLPWEEIQWKSVTSRHPATNKPAIAMTRQLNMMRESLITLYNTFLVDEKYQFYSDIATNAFGGGPKGPNNRGKGSMESLHGTYHSLIGGTGQMGDPKFAAFDPVFWFHHCQIDRLVAIWQAARPESWFNGKDALVPFTFRNKVGEKDNNDWTSDKVRKPDVFGYTYSDAKEGETPDAIKKGFEEKYGWASEERAQEQLGKPPTGMQPLPIFEQAQVFRYDQLTREELIAESKKTGALDAVLNKSSAESKSQMTASEPIFMQQTVLSKSVALEESVVEHEVFPNFASSNFVVTEAHDVKEKKMERTWYVDNVVQRLALNGTFTIFFFIGPFEDDVPAEYAVQPTLAGITHNFAAPVEFCDHCGGQEEQAHLVSGTVVITPILKDYILTGALTDLTPESVVPFLVEFLRWRVVTINGKREDPGKVRGLKVEVSSKVSGPEPGQVKYEVHKEITDKIQRKLF